MGYADTEQVEAGLRFKSASGLVVETTGKSLGVSTHGGAFIHVHEVRIVEGSNVGYEFYHNLDSAKPA